MGADAHEGKRRPREYGIALIGPMLTPVGLRRAQGIMENGFPPTR
jgi:hypothetical protein